MSGFLPGSASRIATARAPAGSSGESARAAAARGQAQAAAKAAEPAPVRICRRSNTSDHPPSDSRREINAEKWDESGRKAMRAAARLDVFAPAQAPLRYFWVRRPEGL